MASSISDPVRLIAAGVPAQEYEDAHGTRSRLVQHHLLLPHEIIGSLYDTGNISMVTGQATCLNEKRMRIIRCLLLFLSLSLSLSRLPPHVLYMYIYIYVYTHIGCKYLLVMCVYIYTIYTRPYACVYIYIYVYTHTYVYMYIHRASCTLIRLHPLIHTLLS